MSLGSKYLARKTKEIGIKSHVSLGHMADGLTPMLHTLNLIGHKDLVTHIEFHWHDIENDICPITIHTKKEAVRTK